MKTQSNTTSLETSRRLKAESNGDYSWSKPWNTPIDITQSDSSEKIKELGKKRDISELQRLTDDELDTLWTEIGVLLNAIEVEATRMGMN